MKLPLIFISLCIGFVHCAPAVEVVEKEVAAPAAAPIVPVAPVVKEEPSAPVAVPVPVAVVPVVPIAKPVKVAPEQEQDASSAELRGPVASANKLLYDLEGTVQQMFEDSTNAAAAAGKEEKSIDDVVEEAQVYSAANRELDFFPRQTAEQTAQSASLVAQLENLERRLLKTIEELQSRRRVISSTMLRQMYNSVHRIRININRIQTQFSSPQSQTVPQASPARPGQAGGGVMVTLQQRVQDIQKAVNDIINRVTSSFQPNAQKPASTGAVPNTQFTQ